MAEAYRIRHWGNGMFEHRNSNGRSLSAMPWVAVPTKHDGKGYLRLASRDPEATVYGCWVLILAVASKCPVRGLLADEDGPLTPEDVALKTHRSVGSMRSAFEVLSSSEIGWLEQVAFNIEEFRAQLARGSPASGAPTGRDGTGRDGTDMTNVRPDPDPIPEPGQASRLKRRPAEEETGAGRVFSKLTREDLGDTGKLRDWLRQQAEGPDPVLEEPTRETLVDVVSAAEHALKKGRNPVALFASLVARREFDAIPASARDRGAERVRKYLSSRTGIN